MKRNEILANREAWIKFLITKGRKKAIEKLDAGGGARCCLGHGAYCLAVKKTIGEDGEITYGKNLDDAYAPEELIGKVGLWNSAGSTEFSSQTIFIKGNYFSTLADVNDSETVNENQNKGYIQNIKFDASPKDIGLYLQSVINGGSETPFTPLTNYPE